MSQCIVSAIVDTTGMLFVCGVSSSTPATNGVHPLATVTAVNADPSIFWQGQSIAIGAAIWYPTSADTGFAAWSLLCGSVIDIAIANGGTGWLNPVATAAGLTLGVPVLQQGIVGYTIVNGGGKLSGGTPLFTSGPRAAVVDSGGSGSGALIHSLMKNGAVIGYGIEAGGSAYVTPTVVVASGQNEMLTPLLSGGGIQGAGWTIVYGGQGYTNGTHSITIADSTGTGAVGTVTIVNGAMSSFNITTPGSGYTAPYPVLAGNLATATATQVGGVIAAVNAVKNSTVFDGAGGYSTPFIGLTIGPPPANYTGPAGNTVPNTQVVVQNGNITHVTPGAGGRPGCGTGYTQGTATLSAVGIGASLLPVLGTGANAGKIVSVTVVQGYKFSSSGGTYPGTVQINFTDATGTGATATATIVSGAISSVTMTNNGSGYTSPSITIAPAGCSLAIAPIFDTYIAYIPVVSSIGTFTAPPPIAISDPGGGSGFVGRALMSGASEGDVLTYTAPSNFIAATSGGALTACPAATNAAISNWSGQMEGVTGPLGAFASLPTLIAGANVGEQPMSPNSATCTVQNRMRQSGFWTTAGAGTLTSDVDGNPAHWTSPTNTLIFDQLYTTPGDNKIDYMGFPIYYGNWTLQYTDANVGTPTAVALWLYNGPQSVASNWNVLPVSQSGPYAGTTTMVPIPAGNITMSGGSSGSITGISLAGINPSLLQGYSGAAVWMPAPGQGAAVCTVVGGTVTAISMASNGAYSSKPSAWIYGTLAQGSLVTVPFDFAYTANPNGWNADVTIYGAQVTGTWSPSVNPQVIPPIVRKGNAAIPVASIDQSPVAVDPNVLDYLGSPNGAVPGAFRNMDVQDGYIGITNVIDPIDFSIGNIYPTHQPWGFDTTLTATAQTVRFVNTDPSSVTYSWSSPKIYGTQAVHMDGTDTFTLTGCTTTVGSNVVTVGSGAAMVGATITGTGIPAGSCVMQVVNATTILIANAATGLAVNATANGTVTLTTTMMYKTVPNTDDGHWVNAVAGSGNTVVFELVCNTPHGFRSGQFCQGTGNATFPVFSLGSPWSPGGVAGNIFVTGPYTFILNMYCAGNSGHNYPCWVNSTSEVELAVTPTGVLTMGSAVTGLSNGNGVAVGASISGAGIPPGTTIISDVSGTITMSAAATASSGGPTTLTISSPWTVTVAIPVGGANVPIQYAVNMVAKFPGSNGNPGTIYHCNLPINASDNLARWYAQTCATGLTPTNDIILEVGNEDWNSSDNQQTYSTCMSGLLGYIPASQQFFGYMTSTGSAPGNGGQAQAILTAHLCDVFTAEWVALGLNPNRIKRLFGSQWGFGGYTVGLLAGATTYGINQIDYIAVAPYLYQQNDQPVLSAVSAAGTAASGAQSLPMAAVNSLARLRMAYCTTNQAYWAANAAPAQAWAVATGNPAPAMACYEGGCSGTIPTCCNIFGFMVMDSFMHPSFRLNSLGWYQAVQFGNPTSPNSGATYAAYYQYLFSVDSQVDLWELAYGTQMPPGDGFAFAYGAGPAVSWPANLSGLIQGHIAGTAAPDCHAHQQGASSPALQGWRDAYGATTSPSPTPTPTGTAPSRRWFSALRRPAVRLRR